MSMADEAGVLLMFAVGMLGLFIVTCIFIVPIKYALKLLAKTAAGALMIMLINVVGESFGLHIALNPVSAAAAGVLGLPGAAAVIILQSI